MIPKGWDGNKHARSDGITRKSAQEDQGWRLRSLKARLENSEGCQDNHGGSWDGSGGGATRQTGWRILGLRITRTEDGKAADAGRYGGKAGVGSGLRKGGFGESRS